MRVSRSAFFTRPALRASADRSRGRADGAGFLRVSGTSKVPSIFALHECA